MPILTKINTHKNVLEHQLFLNQIREGPGNIGTEKWSILGNILLTGSQIFCLLTTGTGYRYRTYTFHDALVFLQPH